MNAIGPESEQEQIANSKRLFPIIDRYLILFIVLEFLVFPFIPFGPLAVALGSLLTVVRTSKWRQVILWLIAGLMALIIAAPFILRWLNFSNYTA